VCTTERKHGRDDDRRYTALELHPEDPALNTFPGIHCAIQRQRSVLEHRTGNTFQTLTYAISSVTLEEKGLEALAHVRRQHWTVENLVHGQRDVRMKEDQNRTHVGNAPMGLACLRNWALNVVSHIHRKNRRLAQTWNDLSSPRRAFAALGI
jgi:predicted transposase YbfD/YdcC